MQLNVFPLNEGVLLPRRLSKMTLRRLIGEGTPICHHTLKKQLLEDKIITKKDWEKIKFKQLLPVAITLKVYKVYKITKI